MVFNGLDEGSMHTVGHHCDLFPGRNNMYKAQEYTVYIYRQHNDLKWSLLMAIPCSSMSQMWRGCLLWAASMPSESLLTSKMLEQECGGRAVSSEGPSSSSHTCMSQLLQHGPESRQFTDPWSHTAIMHFVAGPIFK